MQNDWHINEYKALRGEIVKRIIFLHQTINLHIILQIILLIFGYLLYSQGQGIIFYALLSTIFLNFITFNYQSNQMSLEAISKYIHESLRPKVKDIVKEDVLEWEKYFADHKAHYKFEAFFKATPFIFPNLIPLIVLILRPPLGFWENFLIIFDLVLFIIMIENFRYKLRRVK